METVRSKKVRSLGIESNPSRQPTSTSSTSTSKRPELGERHYSAPSVARRRPSDSRRNAESTKTVDRTKHTSKASSRDDHMLSSTTSVDSQSPRQRRSDAYSVKSSIKSVEREEPSTITFAVVGNASVGKSTFIRNALDLRRPVSLISSTKVSFGGIFYRLQLLETPREEITYTNGSISWPPFYDSRTNPEIDGVFCLYDVSDQDSLEGLDQLLTAITSSELATCLVSCKHDIPVCDQAIPSEFTTDIRSTYPHIDIETARYDESDSAKRCLLRILKRTLDLKSTIPTGSDWLENRVSGSNRLPAQWSTQNSSEVSSRSQSGSRNHSMHSRSREDLLIRPSAPAPASDDDDDSDDSDPDSHRPSAPAPPKTALRVNTNDLSIKIRAGPQTPVSTTDTSGTRFRSPSQREPSGVPATPESLMNAAMARRGSADTTDSRIYRTFLNMDDESINEDNDSTDETSRKLQNASINEDSNVEGVTFGELVDRLLAMPTTKGDQKFVPSFLCLYRAFASPRRLLMCIIDRFVKTESSDLVHFTKTAELLRYLSVLGLWTTYYAGDFADNVVREMALTFVTTVEKTKNYAGAARQIANNLQTLVPDNDEEWAYADEPKTLRSRSNTTSQKSAASGGRRASRTIKKQTKHSPEDTDSDDDEIEGEEIKTGSTSRHSGAPSSSSSLLKASQVSSQTFDNLQHLEFARDQANKYRSIPHMPVSKTQWHQFMNSSTEELAIEITRIDWTMYTAIRPRDFVRWVTISPNQRARSSQTDYIGLMTKHFNHLALFVSGMILLRDKPKHRARMLEKFMDLAWKVRQMNNYNALGAMVAALNSEEIVRLTQTQELIHQDQHKQFLRLKILMGHQKSHAAYRMAWDNSSAERIPFLPRIQEDLTKAAAMNVTMIGNRINWSKFEVMGETIVSIQRSQDQPYNFPDRTARGQDIAKLILETKVLEGDEDCADPKEELYERSKQVEPATAAIEKKKFDWLRR